MNEQKGLFNKYTIINNETGEEVEGSYFVLKPETDKAARNALRIYACLTENKNLAEDLFKWTDELEREEG